MCFCKIGFSLNPNKPAENVEEILVTLFCIKEMQRDIEFDRQLFQGCTQTIVLETEPQQGVCTLDEMLDYLEMVNSLYLFLQEKEKEYLERLKSANPNFYNHFQNMQAVYLTNFNLVQDEEKFHYFPVPQYLDNTDWEKQTPLGNFKNCKDAVMTLWQMQVDN